MTMGAGSPPEGLDRDSLIGPVRHALNDAAAELIDWRHEPLAYTVRTPVSGGIHRLAGSARTHGQVRPWSLVLKVARSPAGGVWPDGRRVPLGWGADPTHSQYWRREALAYRSGLLDDLPGDLTAPHCYGVVERGDDTIWLWLDEVQEAERRPWPLARYGVAARHLGQFNGAYLVGRPIPTQPWLNRGFLRAWTADPARAAVIEPIARAETWAHPLVRAAFPDPVAERLLRLHAERDGFLAALERLPQTLCHLDAFPANLLARRTAAGKEQTVALDWAFVGIAAVGEEIGHLIAWSLMLGEVAVAEAEALRAIVLAGYREGLQEAGWPGSAVELTRAVERGAAFAAALRWALSAANSAVRPAFDERARAVLERNTGRPVAEDMARRARLVSFLLDWLDKPPAPLAMR
ncbi:MAG: hypothetical protein ACR2M3_02105 [Thermomicrobiales bacterium]